MQPLLKGVIPILATPFFEDGSIDLDSQRRLADDLIEQGAHGLGVFGNAGEGYALLSSEKRELMQTIARHVDGRVPLVAGVGATGTLAAVEDCRALEELGADALMVLPPYYLKPDGEGVVAFYRAISDAVTIPIMVQDAPMLSGVAMPPALLARLGREVERVAYAKVEAPPTAPKITAVAAAVGDAVTLMGGLNGQFMIEEIQRGARGVMPAADMTKLFVAIWDALEAGDTAAAWDVFTRALPLIRYELQPGLGVSAAKHNLVSRGVIKTATVREPTRSLDAAGLEELAQLRKLVY
ncbi:MAG: dihydrodipicolinate synthase family protein [Bryobacterales bacterium]|nr:dihydrodipicolinate synthase family protein [Bryobacterales bacterium]